jgi:hypothetical protein
MSRRRVNNKKRFACNHTGKGQYCHRCEHAEKLEKLAESGGVYITNKGYPKEKPAPKKWTKKELLAEAQRLRKAEYV